MDVTECTSIPWHDPWYKDNFSPCFCQLFVERLVPCSVVALSLATLAISALRYRFGRHSCRRSSTNSAAYTSLLGDQATRQRRRRHSGYGAASSRDHRAQSSNADAGGDSDSDDDNEIDDESAYLLETEQAGEQSLKTQSPSSYTRLPPSTRDILLVIFTFAQATLSFCIYRSGSTISKHENNSFFELILWLWAAALCTYLLFRKDPALPSPSPHLRLVYFVGLAIESIKVRTALLAYSRGTMMSLPAVEISMMAIAALLFVASFTQQRRRHGRSSHSLSSSSDKYPPAPEITASISQILFFSWMDPMIYLGYKRSLEPTDVYDLLPEQRSVRVCARWRHEGREYVHKHGSDKRSVTRRMFWFFRYKLMLQCIWTLVNTVFIFTGPFFLKRILAYMEDSSIYTREQAFWCVAGLLIGRTIATVCQSQALWIGRKIGLETKSIIIGEVYAKSLRRQDTASEEDASPSTSKSGDKESKTTSTGKITNLMTVDASKVFEVSAFLHFVYQLPVQIIVSIKMLYQLLGMASIAGIAAILVLVPIQWWNVKLWGIFQDELMKASDKRINITNEIMQGVRIIKFFAWEPQFEKQVASIRGLELRILRKRYFVMTSAVVVFFLVPVLVTLTTFGVYTTVMGKQLTASIAFTALALFKMMRGAMDMLPSFFSSVTQAKVSLDRVSKFLDEEETPKYKLSKLSRRAQEDFVGHAQRASYAEVVGATVIGFIGASFSWKSSTLAPTAASSTTAVNAAAVAESANSDEREPLLSASNLNTDTDAGSNQNMATGTESSAFELQDLTVSFPVGKLSIIAGPTGCGKTSLLMALLGEMRLTAGRLMVPGAAFSTRSMLGEDQADQFALQESVAYVAQQAWLLNDTIRGNIVFGLPFDEKRYHEVVRMCALSRDFEILEAGDMTEVGERGVALSGGQKQRICLARAVYSPARHVIMDDCLSAVDAHTAKHLYDNCLMSPYMSERTRILVTHAVGLTIKGASVVV
ncbi:Transporter of the ATP-binding cassette (ABC), partial [Coemansia sp. Benny D115]